MKDTSTPCTATPCTATPCTTTQSNERGGSPFSVIMILAVVFMIAELVIMGGRVAAAHAQVSNAAREAARTGSLAATAGSVETLARDAAEANLARQGTPCKEARLSIEGTNFDRGGTVVAEVFCVVDLSDLGILPLPFLPDLEVSAEHSEIVETFRVVE